jgi:hypothetical protein
MGSYVGVLKVAAKRLGLAYEEYLSRLNSGLKWCVFGRHWCSLKLFPPDSTRGTGKAQACKECFTGFHKRRPRRKVKRYKRTPAQEKAGHAVNHAITAGKIPNPNTLKCSHCGHFGKDKRHEYHHHKGYEGNTALDVIVLCSLCHRIESRKEIGLETYVIPQDV